MSSFAGLSNKIGLTVENSGSKLRRCQESRLRHTSRFQSKVTCSAAPDKLNPDWTGDQPLSKVVNAAINNKLLYDGIMKPLARRVLINTAEKNGIPWVENSSKLEKTQEVYDLYDKINDASIEYPEYYLKPFHAYSEGNLCWQAAFEAEPATLSMALRVWPKEDLTWQQAQDRLRDSALDCVEEHIEAHSLSRPSSILDVGCGVGISTRAAHARFPEAQVTGLDLSPYMLSVASYRDLTCTEEQEQLKERRSWVHGKGEDTKLPDSSLDMYMTMFTAHELPQQAIADVAREAARIVKPGGVIVLCDNNPRSPVIQGLPPALFTLMKATEPHSDQYYIYDIEKAFREAGFENVHTEASDPRHRTVLGTRSAH